MQYCSILLIFLFLLSVPIHAAGQSISVRGNQDYQQQRSEQIQRQLEYALENFRAINSGMAYNDRYGHSDPNEITQPYPGQNFGNPSNTFVPNHPAAAYDPIGGRNRVALGTTPAARPLTNTANQLTQAMLMEMPVEQPLVYDDDGNLIAAPAGIAGPVGTVLQYDGENRLKSVEPQTPVDGSTKIEYVYDYMSRRAAKKVYTYSSGTWSLTSTTSFIYDGWNLIKEIKYPEPRTLTPEPSYYVWGLDLSGSLQGAGGIGGLLARVNNGLVQHYTYDGNGNVSELINTDGSIAAHYEYDPYGISLTTTGVDNPFRFSTKYLDAETGLYYYGYRYYSPVLGRWLTRDPLGEGGAKILRFSLRRQKEEANLYAFVVNNPLNKYDFFGLYGIEVHYGYTKEIALNVGFSEKCAEKIAQADQSVDEIYDPWESMVNRILWHFPQPGRYEQLINASYRSCDLAQFGMGLHVLQDSYSHAGYGYGLGHAWNPFTDDPNRDEDKTSFMRYSTRQYLKFFPEKCKAKLCCAKTN